MNLFLTIKVLRSWIKRLEDEYYPEGEMQNIKVFSEKELTKKKWVYMLKNSPKTGPLSTITRSLNDISLSIERFSENVADLKSVINDKINCNETMDLHSLPIKYDVLKEKRFEETMSILVKSHPAPGLNET